MLHGAEICLPQEKHMISSLPDDLLLLILSQLPTKVAVKTMVLSKRWRFLWTMTSKLDYTKNYNYNKSNWYFLDKSMKLHKALLLESLSIQLNRNCPDDADIGKWVSYAVNRRIREIFLELHFSSLPKILPVSLYSCKTLEKLTLSNQIIVDVPSPGCFLPSLQSLALIFVGYKDEDTHIKLLSSCPVLKVLFVNQKYKYENVTRFTVKVPSLQKLTYIDGYAHSSGKTLAIDSPGLRYVDIYFLLGDRFSITNMPRLDVAILNGFSLYPTSLTNPQFLTSFSSVKFLSLVSIEAKWFSAINFPRLIELTLYPYFKDDYWLESLMLLLQNSPKLKVLRINYNFELSPRWKQPSCVPVCLSSHLEIFEWKSCRGTEGEARFVTYILANSRHLKTARVAPRRILQYQ